MMPGTKLRMKFKPGFSQLIKKMFEMYWRIVLLKSKSTSKRGIGNLLLHWPEKCRKRLPLIPGWPIFGQGSLINTPYTPILPVRASIVVRTMQQVGSGMIWVSHHSRTFDCQEDFLCYVLNSRVMSLF